MTDLPNFDTLRWLAENEPGELEELRKKLCNEAINRCLESNKKQLTSMLHNLELQLSRCSSPHHRCNLAIGMMNDKLIALNTIMNNPQAFQQQKATVVDHPSNKPPTR